MLPTPARKSWFISSVLSRPRRRASISANRRAVKSSASGSAPVARTPIASPSTGSPVSGSRAIQPHPPELAHVAEADFAAVGQRQHDVDVAILGVPAATTNSWPVILRWTVGPLASGARGPRGPAGSAGRSRGPRVAAGPSQTRSCFPRRPTPSISRPATPPRRLPASWLRNVGGQLELRIHDPRARHQAAQIAGDRLDFRQFGHTKRVAGPRPARARLREAVARATDWPSALAARRVGRPIPLLTARRPQSG